MKRYPGMNITRGALLATALFAAACGGRESSVASKSAPREVQAKGVGTDQSAHTASTGTAAVDHSTMDHSAHGADANAHAGMNHGAPAGGATDHSGHAAAGSVDHAAMGHDTATNAHAGHTGASSTNVHAGHRATPTTRDAHAGHSGTPRTPTHDQHAGMQHGTASTAGNAHAQHRVPTASADHSQHGSTHTAASTGANAHAQHGTAAPTTAPMIAVAPRSNTEMQRMRPAATLQRDAFDAPAAISVSEAAKAAQGGGHEGHQTRGITPGQDRENPPTPMPATRDGSTSTTTATDHSQHGAQPAATLYTCPMHPEVTSDQPGTCPKCGMALVKKK